jgi:hypothetical protein
MKDGRKDIMTDEFTHLLVEFASPMEKFHSTQNLVFCIFNVQASAKVPFWGLFWMIRGPSLGPRKAKTPFFRAG